MAQLSALRRGRRLRKAAGHKYRSLWRDNCLVFRFGELFEVWACLSKKLLALTWSTTQRDTPQGMTLGLRNWTCWSTLG